MMDIKLIVGTALVLVVCTVLIYFRIHNARK